MAKAKGFVLDDSLKYRDWFKIAAKNMYFRSTLNSRWMGGLSHELFLIYATILGLLGSFRNKTFSMCWRDLGAIAQDPLPE